MQSILLVDDEISSCAELKRTLQMAGFAVKTTTYAEGALHSMQRGAFDAVVIEFNIRSKCRRLPRSGNGLRLVRRLRSFGIATPILIYTSMKGNEYEAASLEAGADEFIPKTSAISYFITLLLKHIRRSQLKS